jgi:hypothetical protein
MRTSKLTKTKAAEQRFQVDEGVLVALRDALNLRFWAGLEDWERRNNFPTDDKTSVRRCDEIEAKLRGAVRAMETTMFGSVLSIEALEPTTEGDRPRRGIPASVNLPREVACSNP